MLPHDLAALLREVLTGFADAPSRHAALVHVPIALALLAPLLVVGLAFTRGRSPVLRRGALGAYALLVLTLLLAAWSGTGAKAELGGIALEARERIRLHEWMARRAWIPALVALLALAGTAARARRASAVALALSVAAAPLSAGWIALVGHLGGTAVYAFGAGTPAPLLAREARRAPPSDELARDADPRVARVRNEVLPLLVRACVGCHGPGDLASGGLDLSSIEGILRGGARGPAVVPGDPKASWLYRSATWAEGAPRMPSGQERLDPAALAALRAWIEEGAVWVAD